MVEQIVVSFKLPSWMGDVLFCCTGPLRLRYPKGEIVEETSRGILMGLPTTWFFLCLVHLFWVEEAVATVVKTEHRRMLAHRVAICGDDLVAHWPMSVSQRYHTVLKQCHGIISGGKHFRLKTAGVFTEVCFRVKSRTIHDRKLVPSPVQGPRKVRGKPFVAYEGNNHMKFKQLCTASVRWPNAIPLRGLTRPRRLPGETSIVPTWAAIGPASSSIAAGNPHRAKKVRRVLDVLHPGIEKWAHTRGLIPNLPRLFGGFGLPGRTLTLKDVPRWVRICLRGVLYRSSVQDIMSFGRPWSSSKPVPFR